MKDATLTTAQAAAISLKLARAFHWLCYDERRQAEILRRVERLVQANPGGYLARVAKEVYR